MKISGIDNSDSFCQFYGDIDTQIGIGARSMTFHDQINPRAAPAHGNLSQRSGPAAYDARRLVQDDGTATIVLDDKTYQLRITRAGKLILTK